MSAILPRSTNLCNFYMIHFEQTLLFQSHFNSQPLISRTNSKENLQKFVKIRIDNLFNFDS